MARLTPIDILGLTRGDTEKIKVNIARNGTPVDLAGSVLWFTVKKAYSDLDENAVIKKNSDTGGLGGIEFSVTAGEAIISFTAGETDDIICEPFKYLYDVQLVSTSSPVDVETVAAGAISWVFDVTRSIA